MWQCQQQDPMSPASTPAMGQKLQLWRQHPDTLLHVFPQARCGLQRGQPQTSGACGIGLMLDTSCPWLTTSAPQDSWWMWPWARRVTWPML